MDLREPRLRSGKSGTHYAPEPETETPTYSNFEAEFYTCSPEARRKASMEQIKWIGHIRSEVEPGNTLNKR